MKERGGKRKKEEERGGKRRRKEEEEEDKGKNRMTEANGLKIRNSPPIVLLEGGGWGVEGGVTPCFQVSYPRPLPPPLALAICHVSSGMEMAPVHVSVRFPACLFSAGVPVPPLSQFQCNLAPDLMP